MNYLRIQLTLPLKLTTSEETILFRASIFEEINAQNVNHLWKRTVLKAPLEMTSINGEEHCPTSDDSPLTTTIARIAKKIQLKKQKTAEEKL